MNDLLMSSPIPDMMIDLMADVNNPAMKSVQIACKFLDHPREWKQDGTQGNKCFCSEKKYLGERK
jgi:hypothetical protein